jgi:hypothetical protein
VTNAKSIEENIDSFGSELITRLREKYGSVLDALNSANPTGARPMKIVESALTTLFWCAFGQGPPPLHLAIEPPKPASADAPVAESAPAPASVPAAVEDDSADATNVRGQRKRNANDRELRVLREAIETEYASDPDFMTSLLSIVSIASVSKMMYHGSALIKPLKEYTGGDRSIVAREFCTGAHGVRVLKRLSREEQSSGVIESLPEHDQSVEQMCRLLVGTRLGARLYGTIEWYTSLKATKQTGKPMCAELWRAVLSLAFLMNIIYEYGDETLKKKVATLNEIIKLESDTMYKTTYTDIVPVCMKCPVLYGALTRNIILIDLPWISVTWLIANGRFDRLASFFTQQCMKLAAATGNAYAFVTTPEQMYYDLSMNCEAQAELFIEKKKKKAEEENASESSSSSSPLPKKKKARV